MANLPFAPGTLVRVSGARSFTGTFRGGSDLLMIVTLDAHNSVMLRRDLASTTPEQWRLQGLPVAVEAAGTNPDFTARLARVLELARRQEERADYIDPDEGRE